MVRPHVALLLLLGACGGGEGGPPDARPAGQPDARPAEAGTPVSFEEVEVIFNAACTEGGCHGPSAAGGLVLHEGAYEALVGVPARGCAPGRRMRVVPFDPAASALLDKLKGVRLCGGKRMPLGCDDTAARPCLSPARVAAIEAWIAGGARRD